MTSMTIHDMFDIAALSLEEHGASKQEGQLHDRTSSLLTSLRTGYERELIRSQCVDVIISAMAMLLNASDDYSDVEKIMTSKFTSLLMELRK